MYYINKGTKRQKSKKRTLQDKLDKVFSRYIRLRDAFSNGTFKCISCGRIKPISLADCGHYWSRRHMATRYDEENCNAECSHCNRFSADHLDGYRRHLIEKIGLTRFKMLDIRHTTTKKWSDWELDQLIKYYTVLCKSLQREKGVSI